MRRSAERWLAVRHVPMTCRSHVSGRHASASRRIQGLSDRGIGNAGCRDQRDGWCRSEGAVQGGAEHRPVGEDRPPAAKQRPGSEILQGNGLLPGPHRCPWPDTAAPSPNLAGATLSKGMSACLRSALSLRTALGKTQANAGSHRTAMIATEMAATPIMSARASGKSNKGFMTNLHQG